MLDKPKQPDDYLLRPMERQGLPARLAKLQRKKKRKRKMTLEDIEKKLEKAEARRKVSSSHDNFPNRIKGFSTNKKLSDMTLNET